MRIDLLYHQVKRLQETSGSNAKKLILKEYKNDEYFKKFLSYVLDPLKIYGLQDKKIKKHLDTQFDSKELGFKDLFDLFEYLLEHNTGKDSDAIKVARFINNHDEIYRDFILESITKKIRLGVKAKIVNEVYGKNFISIFSPMLAEKFTDRQDELEEYLKKSETNKFFITEKIDGKRTIIVKDEDKVEIYSREGRSQEGLVEIENEIMKYPDGIYDGELVSEDYNLLKDRDVLQQTLSIAQSKGEKTGLILIVFDYLTLYEWQNEQCKRSYTQRRNDNPLNSHNLGESEHIKLIPILYHGRDIEKIIEWTNKMDSEGKEGVMVNYNLPYEFKRSKTILKVKTMLTADLEIIGFEQGKPLTQFKDTLGTIIVDYKGYKVGVNGISNELRDKIWHNQDDYLGKIIEVSYFRESKNKQGGLSLSFAQFKGFRTDKTEPSYY